MVPDIQNLIELQRADREILRLKEEIAALPKRVAAIEERLAGTKAVLRWRQIDGTNPIGGEGKLTERTQLGGSFRKASQGAGLRTRGSAPQRRGDVEMTKRSQLAGEARLTERTHLGSWPLRTCRRGQLGEALHRAVPAVLLESADRCRLRQGLNRGYTPHIVMRRRPERRRPKMNSGG